MPLSFSNDEELSRRVFDVLALDDDLLIKAVCLFAVRKCSGYLSDELADGLAEKIACGHFVDDPADGAGNGLNKNGV